MNKDVFFHRLQSLLDWSYANDLRLDFSLGHVTVMSRDINDSNCYIRNLDYSSVDEAYFDIFCKDVL